MRDKLTPKKLNKSADELLIPKTNLIDALNVLVTESEGEGGNEGVIKAARGNEQISYTASTGTGTAKVIGSTSDNRLKVIYLYVYSSVPAEHGVYVYDPYGNLPEPSVAGQVSKVWTSAKFNFDEFGFVTGDVVYINNQTILSGDKRYEKDPILYFTDGKGEPKKLNVFKCLLGGGNVPSGTGDNETDFITACPKLGLKTIRFDFEADTSRSTSNFVNTKGFQFAYQLIYKDGVETAISPYSDIAFPPVIVNQGANESVDYLANNVCKLYLDQAVGLRSEIDKIRLLAREGNDGFFFAIDEFEKGTDVVATYETATTNIWDSTNYVYSFYNDRVVTGTSPIEVAKQYDNLPRKAKAQAVVNNRLMYGNYLDGYNEQPINCESSLIFSKRPLDFATGVISVRESIREIPGSDQFGNNTIKQINKTSSYIVDCTSLPGEIEEGTIINLSIQLSPDRNFHLYDARKSYHQHATIGDSRDYNHSFSGSQDDGNLARFPNTFQDPYKAGEGFLQQYPDHGNTSAPYPVFGNNGGVINNLKWRCVDGPPGTEGTNYVGTELVAALGTSAGAPFIIPASGPSGQLTFSVSLSVLQDMNNSPERVSHAICAVLSGVDDLSQLVAGATAGLDAYLSVISVNRVSTINVDQGYENFQTFYDSSPTGKLVMSVSGQSTQGAALGEVGEVGEGGTDALAGERAGSAAKGYVLLDKGDIDFFLEHHFIAPDEDGLNGQEGQTTEAGYGQHELRLGIKDMDNLRFVTCMRKADYRGVKTIDGGTGGRKSAVPWTQSNGQFDMYDHAPWFILKGSLMSSQGFSLQAYNNQLPASPEGIPGTLSLRKVLPSGYESLLDDVNFTVFRYLSAQYLEEANNVTLDKLVYPNFFQEFPTGALAGQVQDAGLYQGLIDPAGVSSDLSPDMRFLKAYTNTVEGKDDFRYSCGLLVQAGGYNYTELEFGGIDAQPNATSGPNDNYGENIRFKKSLMDGEGGPGGFQRIQEGAASIYGSVGYASATGQYAQLNEPAPVTQYSAGNPYYPNIVMLGPYWNGSIVSGDYRSFYWSQFADEAVEAAKDFLNEIGKTTIRSQDAFLMPGLAAPGHRADAIDASEGEFDMGGSFVDTEISEQNFHPLGAYTKVGTLQISNVYTDPNGTERRSLTSHQRRIYNRSDKNGNVESTAFGGLVGAVGAANRSFKSSAFHSFGVVYYDERGRHGFVNPATTVYVPGYSTAERTEDSQGKVDVVLDFSDTVPPPWAKNWKLVYAPNSTVDFFVQHMSGGAYTTASAQEGGSSVIYVSLNYLQESSISYTSAFGARGPEGELNIYKYKDGDKVRVVSYQDVGGDRIYPKELIFDVVDVKNFGPTENPLTEQGSTNAPNWLQGQFLVLRNNPLAEGFSFNDVNNGQDFWGDNCLMEIFSPKKKQSEEALYYEIPDQAYTDLANDYLPFCSEGELFPSSVTVTQGDVWWRPIAMNIRTQETGLEDANLFDISPTGLVNVIEDTSLGAQAGYNPSTPNFQPVTAEAFTASDLIDGDSSFIGRPNAYLPGAKETIREATITYSDFNAPESNKINYSSFNIATSNFKDLNEEFRGIDFMMNESGDVLVIQEERVSVVPASKTLFSDTQGSSTVVASTNVLSTAKTFGIRAGCDGNPESVAITPKGHVYFAHKTLGKIYRYAPGGGITVISDKNMASFFRNAFNSALATSTASNFEDIRVVGGFDPLTNEYLITIKDLGDDEVGGDVYDPSETIYGCTDTSALNYNQYATVDDGSCVFPEDEPEEEAYIELDFSPSAFNFGQNFLTQDQVDALAVGGAVADTVPGFSAIVYPENIGDVEITIDSIGLYGVSNLNDFNVGLVNASDAIVPVDGIAGDGIKLTWDFSGAYIINASAKIKVVYYDTSDPSNSKVGFIDILGSTVAPGVEPPVARYVKVWLDDLGPNEVATDHSFNWESSTASLDYNLPDGQGFPAAGSVPAGVVKVFPQQESGVGATKTYQIKMECSGITPEEALLTDFSFDFNDDKVLVNANITDDIASLIQTNQDSDLNTTGEFSLGSLTLTSISDILEYPWEAGLETATEWLDSGSNPFSASLPSVTFDSPFTMSLVVPDDVGTNFSAANGSADFVFDISTKVGLTTPGEFGYIPNSPRMIRMNCELPGCFKYSAFGGETNVPIDQFWRETDYTSYKDYTIFQYNQDNFLHPILISDFITVAPYWTNNGFFNVNNDTFKSVQVNKVCPAIHGCTIPTACNYDATATYNDGSCVFPEPEYDCDGNFTGEIYGCTNPTSSNYNDEATIDDGSCIIQGCTNPQADNYNPAANEDDGSCLIRGCTDPNATNYNPNADVDDGSCDYVCDVSLPCDLDVNGSGVVTQAEFAIAFNLAVVDAASEFSTLKEKYPAFQNCDKGDITRLFDLNGDGDISTADFLIFLTRINFPFACKGTDLTARNLCTLLDENGNVTLESVSSAFGVVVGSGEVAFTQGVDFDGDGVVSYTDYLIATELVGMSIDDALFGGCNVGGDDDDGDGDDGGDGGGKPGCTDPTALNYDSLATADDGSCVYESEDDSKPEEDDEVGPVGPVAPDDPRPGTSNDNSGCTDPKARNFDPSAQFDDGSCLYFEDATNYGCMDPDATNYDSTASVDDGSCIYPTSPSPKRNKKRY